MNKDTMQGNWEQLKGKVRQMWGKLTDNDVAVIQGKSEQLIGKLQERYGYTREKAESEISRFCQESDPDFNDSDDDEDDENAHH